jgi:hypothetical protein
MAHLKINKFNILERKLKSTIISSNLFFRYLLLTCASYFGLLIVFSDIEWTLECTMWKEIIYVVKVSKKKEIFALVVIKSRASIYFIRTRACAFSYVNIKLFDERLMTFCLVFSFFILNSFFFVCVLLKVFFFICRLVNRQY